MKIGFDNLSEHIIPMAEFPLKWRLTEPQYEVLPQIHLDQLKPLDKTASKFLWDYIVTTRLHNEAPFKRDFFSTVDKKMVLEGNEQDVKKWIYRRGLPFEKEVYLSWQPGTAMVVPWKILIKYFDCFYYPIADDLTVIDQSLNWALLFFHEHEIYFGSNEKYVPAVNEDERFLY